MKRPLLVAALLTATITACSSGSAGLYSSGSSPTPSETPSPTASPTASPTPEPSGPPDVGTCTASASGSKDLTKKPVFTVSKAPAPTETTTTDIVCGTGEVAKDGDGVTVQYVGVDYANGKQFDSSWDRGEPFQFDIGGNVIPGFSKGVTGMRVGGRRLVVIPPKDGYGDQGPVPGGTLAFIIDLVKVG